MIDTKVSQNNRFPMYLTSTQLVGMNWVEVPAGKYKIVKQNNKSHCQLEIIMRLVDAIKSLPRLIWLATMLLFLILPKENGLRWHHYGFLVLILNVQVARVSFRRPPRIL